MPLDEDKYPSESGRRRFVKGVVGSAALGSVATGTAATVEMVTSSAGAGGGITPFIAIENTDGPAPRGMPMVPIEIKNGNEIHGVWPEPETVTGPSGRQVTVAEMDMGGITYSSTWYQYCGVQTYEGIAPDADQDNAFRSSSGTYTWQDDVEDGSVLTLDMFDDYEEWGNGIGQAGLGKPAVANWRSEGDVSTIPVQVMRSPEVSKMANGEGKYSSLSGTVRSFLAEATSNDVMAWLNKCTHFCCVPGFKAFSGSAKFDGADRVYCQCHQSIYNPFNPIQATYTALPRPDE
jgi:Rieske Fe-S protein